MTEKDRTQIEEHDHDDLMKPEIITLDMEDGTTKDFVVLAITEVDEEHYIALAEVGSDEYDILSFTENEDGETIDLNVIADDDLFDKVADAFEEYFASFDEMEEM